AEMYALGVEVDVDRVERDGRLGPRRPARVEARAQADAGQLCDELGVAGDQAAQAELLVAAQVRSARQRRVRALEEALVEVGRVVRRQPLGRLLARAAEPWLVVGAGPPPARAPGPRDRAVAGQRHRAPRQ